ncbi:major facilitator superfamily MFS_1 [Brevundimonas subvibrioides ATCC 15264]|uniref:Major facilitator superfamily MFS_1 n=2 Tax=Brevundimonas subvibrioides TaxID=74313 RepID=D9QK16_BRESC|nr:major facilitator superfamily MFS_1 [Brevundimonas subvibrioides ATCC 15264]
MIPARRMALQYVLLFGANGVSLPFAGLWFAAQGFSGVEIGTLLAAPMLARVVTGPVLAVWADGFTRRRTPIAILGAVAALAYAGAGLTQGVWIQGALWWVGASAMAATIPLTDVLNLASARRHGFAFAWPRGCGSAAFVAANVLMGAVLARASIDWVIVWIVVAGALIAVTASAFLPPEPVSDDGPGRKRDRYAGLARLALDPGFMTAILAIGAIQATHAFYYGFSAIAWKAQGISEAMTGLLWAVSVVVEIAFMWVIEPWRRARGIGPWLVLVLGGCAAVVRWTMLAVAPPLWALWPLQALHALTFAATYLAGVEIIERLAPPGQHTGAQTLNSVMAAGILIGLATLAAGPLYDRFGTLGYLAMTGLAMVGLLAAWRLKRVLAVS